MSTIEQLAAKLSICGRQVEFHGSDRLLVGDPWDNIAVVAWRDADLLNIHQGYYAAMGIASVDEAAQIVLSF
jgi:hypothetical protein